MQEAWRLEEAGERQERGDALRRDRLQRDEGRLRKPRLHRLGMDRAVALPGHPVPLRLRWRSRARSPSSPSRRPARSTPATTIPPTAGSFSTATFRSRRFWPSSVRSSSSGFTGQSHRCRHSAAEAAGQVLAAPAEDLPREARHAPGGPCQRHDELAPAGGHRSRGDRDPRGALRGARGERRLAPAQGAGRFRARRGSLPGERAGDGPASR